MTSVVSDVAGRKRTKTKADVSSAYTNASTRTTTRGKRFLRCPATCQQFDEDGTPLVLELGPPLFGEPEPRGGARQPTAYKGPVSQGLPGFMASRVPTQAHDSCKF